MSAVSLCGNPEFLLTTINSMIFFFFFLPHLSLQICAKICEHWGCKWKPLGFHSLCVCILFIGCRVFCFSLYAWKIAAFFFFFLVLSIFLSAVGSGTRWKFPAFCSAGVCHCRDGRGSTATHRWQTAGWDTYQGVLLCPGSSWKKHVGCSDCCTNHGTVFQSTVFAWALKT